jgi:hypothetical protein
MSTTAASIVYEAQRAMNDASGVRAPASDLVKLLNRAQRDIAVSRPDTTAAYIEYPLQEGYRQTLPDTAAVLLDIPANATGNMRSIMKVNQSLLDASSPEWRSSPQAIEVVNFVHDSRTPRQFLVFPPAQTGAAVLMEASLYPEDIPAPLTPGATASDVVGNISLADEWSTALLNVTLYYAYLTDLEGSNNPNLAAGYRSMAEQILGTQLQASVLASKSDGESK